MEHLVIQNHEHNPQDERRNVQANDRLVVERVLRLRIVEYPNQIRDRVLNEQDAVEK